MTERDTEDELCDYGDCTEPAVAVYEGTRPPASAFRYKSCSDHSPDAPPIRYLREELA